MISGIYFVRMSPGTIKIGCSMSVRLRLSKLGRELDDLLAVLPCRASQMRQVESELHAMFDAHRVNGEVFRAHSSIIDYARFIARHRVRPVEARQTETPE